MSYWSRLPEPHHSWQPVERAEAERLVTEWNASVSDTRLDLVSWKHSSKLRLFIPAEKAIIREYRWVGHMPVVKVLQSSGTMYLLISDLKLYKKDYLKS